VRLGWSSPSDGLDFDLSSLLVHWDADGQTKKGIQRFAAEFFIVRQVFHRDCRPIRNFRRAWSSSCQAEGTVGRLVHDFRRTAARNLSRAGVSERVIMALCGWKTRSVFDRYGIVNEAGLAEGLAKLANVARWNLATAKVVPLRTGTERAQ
jgi:integrase